LSTEAETNPKSFKDSQISQKTAPVLKEKPFWNRWQKHTIKNHFVNNKDELVRIIFLRITNSNRVSFAKVPDC